MLFWATLVSGYVYKLETKSKLGWKVSIHHLEKEARVMKAFLFAVCSILTGQRL